MRTALRQIFGGLLGAAPGPAGHLGPTGAVTLQVIRKDSWIPEEFRRRPPKSELGRYIWQVVCRQLPVEMARELLERLTKVLVIESSLYGVHIAADGTIVDRGLLSRKLVTTAGVNFIVDAFQNTVEVENLKFHGIGTGTNAEATGDTALQTELTTQYNPDNTRATGSTTEGASANIYRTVGTNTVDASAAVTEHGILSQAATGGGTLLDRSVFSVINLANGDSLQTTYDLTCSAGG